MTKTSPETILFAVVGMTPAVLTETAWALAREKPATLPRRVVVVTTRAGRERLRRDVLDSGVWAELRRALKAGDALQFADTGAHIRVISNAERELDDIRTREDNTAAADFVLENLRAFTENPELRVVATIAGGRKTMSALLYAAMTLIGRETDRITHVLASEDLETRRNPPFFFPRTAAEGQRLQLADIPFVPLRNRFEELGRLPGGFSAMVTHYTRALRRERLARIELDPDRSVVTVDGKPVPLRARAFQTLSFLIEVNRSNRVPDCLSRAADELRAALGERGEWIADEQDLRRELGELRRALRAAGLDWHPGLRRDALILPPFEIEGRA
jgi:CRISPR-associated protein (TIGR02584 family)